MEPEQFRLVLDEARPRDARGLRDAALLLFLYNTGARVSEALQLRWSDLVTEGPRQVRLHGKGGRDRLCPLWKQTTRLLRQLRQQTAPAPEGSVFLSARGQPLTRDGVAYVLRRCYHRAQQRHPSLPKFPIHPHTLRHSCAVALLQAGIELTAIRDYLGHATVASTSRYLHTNLAMQQEVLRRFWKRAGLDPGGAQTLAPECPPAPVPRVALRHAFHDPFLSGVATPSAAGIDGPMLNPLRINADSG